MGTQTSITNTPQATADSYTLREDEILASPSLYNYNTTSRTFTFDVMANDLGGNAKSLFSVEDDWGNPIGSDTTLLDKDTLDTAGASQWELTANGNWIRIVYGKIEYRIADPLHPNDPCMARDVNSLGVNDSVVNDTFVYAIRLGNGTLSKATVTINIAGANDGPVANSDSATTGENAAINVNVLANDSDQDSADTLTVLSATAPPGQGTASVVSNQVHFDPGTDFDHLNVGDSEVVTITYTVTDGHGAASTVTSTVTITVTGTNDGPVANADTGSTGENTTVLVDVLANDTDVDDGAVLTVTAASAPVGQGTASVVSNQVQFDPGSDFDYLAVGETASVTVNYTIEDEHGAAAASTVTITVTGTNDVPTVAAALTFTEAEGGFGYPLDLVEGASDADHDETATLTVTGVSYTVDDGASTTTAPGGVALSGTTLYVNPQDPGLNELAVGESRVIVVSYGITDVHGATVPQTATVTITGTNDIPLIEARLTSTAAEDSAAYELNLLEGASDLDHGETETLHVSGVWYSVDGVSSFTPPAGVSLSGSTLTVDPSDNAFDSLALGESRVIVVTYFILDAQEEGLEQTATITITGTNDAPVLTIEDTAGSLTEDVNVIAGDLIRVSGELSATDVDATDVLNISHVYNDDAVWTGGSLSSAQIDTLKNAFGTIDTEWFYNASNATLQFLAEGETITLSFTVAVFDDSIALNNSDTEIVTITITGTNDAPVLDSATSGGALWEGIDLSASGTLNFTDADTTDTHTVASAYNGDALWTGGELSAEQIAVISAGLTLSQNSLNSYGWEYALSNAAVDFLAEGEFIQLSFDITVTDDSGTATDSATQTVFITINGANDNPVLTVQTAGGVTEDAAEPTLTDSGTLSFTDADVSDTHTVGSSYNDDAIWTGGDLTEHQIAVLSAAFSADSDSWDYNLANAAVDFLADGDTITLSFDVTVTDNHGGSDTKTVTIIITGTNDGPVANADTGSTGENATVLVDVLANDTDVDDGAVLTVTAASAPVGQGTAGVVSNQVQFDPGSDFDYLAVGETASVTVNYTIEDELGASSSSTIDITVMGTNDGPVVNPVTGDANEDGPAITVTADFTDADTNDTHAFSVDTTGTLGLVTDNGDGTFTYDPNGQFESLGSGDTATDTFTYTVTDNNGLSSTATVTVTITGADDAAPNAAPTATADTIIVSSTTTMFLSADWLLANDIDADGDHLEITDWAVVGALPNNWIVTPVIVDNVITGFNVTTSAANNTSAVLTYTISDGNGHEVDGSFTISGPGTTSTGGTNTINISGLSYNYSYIDALGGGDTVTGNAGLDTFIGGDGNDVINGGNGNDLLIGGSGDDAGPGGAAGLVGGGGDDVLRGGTGNDNLDGGAGTDLIDFSDSTVLNTGVNFALSATGSGSFVATGVGLGTDTYANIEGAVGTAYNDILTGNAGNNILRGGAGTDTLNGMGGVDLIDLSDATAGGTFTLAVGGSGSISATGLGTDNYTGMEGIIGTGFDDTINGNDGDNVLRGGAGNDTLSGGIGNDTLVGGAGANILTGGLGNDSFVITPPLFDADEITDYSNVVGNADVIDISQILSVATGTDVVAGGYVRVTTTGLLQVDTNGGADNWLTIASVNTSGISSYTIQYLLNGAPATVSVAPVAPPIGIDLDGDGQVGFLATDAGVTFDYGGGSVATAWVAPEDGILVRDGNHDGAVTHDEMVFATTGSDLEGLAAYDSNQDGTLDGSDEGFADFAVWQDSNSNGVVDGGEMASLTALGIASISLTSDGIGYSAADGDVQVVGTGSYTRADGTTGVLADSVFATGGLSSEEQVRSALTAGPSVAMIGAVAAAGLLAVPVQAEFRPASDPSVDSDVSALAPAVQSVSALGGSGQNHALSGETRIPLDSLSDAVTSHAMSTSAAPQEAHVAEAADDPVPDAMSSLLQGTELPDAAASTQQFGVGDAVLPVSAEMLQSAIAGIAAHSAEPSVTASNPSVDLSQVLADAISGGSAHAPDIDALLTAMTGADCGPSALSLAVGHGGDFAAEFLSLASLTQQMAVSEIMLVHQDALPAAV